MSGHLRPEVAKAVKLCQTYLCMVMLYIQHSGPSGAGWVQWYAMRCCEALAEMLDALQIIHWQKIFYDPLTFREKNPSKICQFICKYVF